MRNMNEDTYTATVDHETGAVLPEDDETVELYLVLDSGTFYVGDI